MWLVRTACTKRSTTVVSVLALTYATSPPHTRISYHPTRVFPVIPLSIPVAVQDSALGKGSVCPVIPRKYSRPTIRPLLPCNALPPLKSLVPYNTASLPLASYVCLNRALPRAPNQNHRSAVRKKCGWKFSWIFYWFMRTLRTQLLFTRRFPGFMSLCSILAECKYFSPKIQKKNVIMAVTLIASTKTKDRLQLHLV